MANHTKQQKISEEVKAEALKIARGSQKPGQTKEQTKLIAQGIQKGIDQYKKQQKSRARELDKQLKKVKNQRATEPETVIEEVVVSRVSLLPWGLLALSWAFFAVYVYLKM